MSPSTTWPATGLLTISVASLLCWLPLTASAQKVQPFSTATGESVPPPWRLAGLPRGKAPLTALGVIERNILRLARLLSAENLPAATLCYVWDQHLPVGTQLPNAYTPRLRFVVLSSGDRQLGQWVTHERDLVLTPAVKQ